MSRSLRTIAKDIGNDWGNVNFGAVPYLQAMRHLDSVEDSYGCDSAREIVIRFLCNASTWRGDVAKRVKTELKAMLAGRG